jgi:hypothetical protein
MNYEFLFVISKNMERFRRSLCWTNASRQQRHGAERLIDDDTSGRARPAIVGRTSSLRNMMIGATLFKELRARGKLPNAVGANPTATISALSEMVAEGITGIRPTADL